MTVSFHSLFEGWKHLTEAEGLHMFVATLGEGAEEGISNETKHQLASQYKRSSCECVR